MTMVFRRSALALALVFACLPSPASESEKEPAAGASATPAAVAGEKEDRPGEPASRPTAIGYLARAVCFPVSWAVGTPVAMVRDGHKEWLRETRVWTGESKNPMATLPAGLIWMPFASFAGFIRGPVIAGNHAWSSRPLSKDSFSLGENLKWYGPDGEENETEN